MTEISSTPKQEIKLFYCYAHEDKDLRDELQVNLAGLRRQYQLTNWYDREILPGENWEKVIDSHLSTADVILLLISPHFVDSDYCYGKEMQRALARHAAGDCCIIPILLRPTWWEEAPFSTIQILPTDARPITSWSDRYEAFHDVAKNISKAIKALITSRIQRAKEQWINKGTSDYNVGRYKEAFAAFEQAVHLVPTDANAYICMGTALEKLKRYNEALTAYVQAISLDPNNTTVYTNMNNALDELNRCKETLNAYEQAICLDPTGALNYYNKGTILYNLGQYEEALAALDQVIRLDPDNFDAYIEKSKTLDALGRQTEAQHAYDIAINML